MSLVDLAGQGIYRDLGRLTHLDVDDVSLVDFYLGGYYAHVGQGHENGARCVLDTDDNRFAFLNGHIRDDSVERRSSDRLIEHVLIGPQSCDLCAEVPAR